MPDVLARLAHQARWRIGRALVVERVEQDGLLRRPSLGRRLATRLDQALVEGGRTAPWVMSADEVREYWASRDTSADANNPLYFAHKDVRIVDFMAHFWSPEVGRGDRVFELGPNAGSNLNRLRELGYSRLYGADINPHALEELERSFPELAGSVTLWTGAFEDVLPTIEDDAFDVVFTTAVLMHVHPSSHRIFREIVRIAGRHVCVIEPEETSNTYVFPRNYGRVFRRLGCRELRSVPIGPETAPDVHRDYDGYTARLFAAP